MQKDEMLNQTTALLLTARHGTYPAVVAEVIIRFCLPDIGWIPPKEHCQVLAFLSFHAESSAQLRQGTVVFSLKSTHKKLTLKCPKLTGLPAFTPWGVCRDKTKLQEAPGSCGHTACLHTFTLILGWDPRQSQVQSHNTQLQVKPPGRKIPHGSCLPPHSSSFFLRQHPWERRC